MNHFAVQQKSTHFKSTTLPKIKKNKIIKKKQKKNTKNKSTTLP